MSCTKIKNGFVCSSGSYELGDLPPKGYNAWHEWAKVQHEAGLKQVACGKYGKVKFPQELSGESIESPFRKTKHGPVFTKQSPICTQCASGDIQ